MKEEPVREKMKRNLARDIRERGWYVCMLRDKIREERSDFLFLFLIYFCF